MNGALDRLVNATPHDVVVVDVDGNSVVIPPSGVLPRIVEDVVHESARRSEVITFRYCEAVIGELVDLPEPRDGVVYVVSRLVAYAAPHRRDLLVPFDEIREEGRVVGCRALANVSRRATTMTPRTSGSGVAPDGSG